jgi:hypothetical protein
MEGGTSFDDGAYGFGGMILPDSGVTKETRAAIFTLTPPKSSVDPLKPGDGYQFGIYRRTDSGDDTCSGELHIDAVSVRY